MKTIGTAWLVGAGIILGVHAGSEPFRTDINPALKYYQAFLLTPELQPADREVLDADWRGQKLPARFGELVANYDGQFSLVRQAAHATVPCDWGIDMSAGTATLLPHLARAKAVAQAARLRAQWDLQQGRSREACEDLAAAIALGRNIARNGTIISALVRIAIEAIVCSCVAENFGQYSPEGLKGLQERLNTLPTRVTIVDCIPVEKSLFHDRTIQKIRELQQQHRGNDAEAIEEIRRYICPDGPEGNPEERKDFWERTMRASGGTSEGVLKLLEGRSQLYDRLTALLALPYPQYEQNLQEFNADIQESSNPFTISLASILKARQREFRISVQLEMVRAAVEYKLHGEAGLQKIADPCGNGPFTIRRFLFEGVDRGFEVRSAYKPDWGGSETVIFVEKDGAPFYVTGAHTGQAISKESTEDAFRRRYGLPREK